MRYRFCCSWSGYGRQSSPRGRRYARDQAGGYGLQIEIHGTKGGITFRKGEITFWLAKGEVETSASPASAGDDMVRSLRYAQQLWCKGRKSLDMTRPIYESVLNREKLVFFDGC